MIEVVKDVPAPPAQVFAVLADGWSLGGWVVGASHIRAVDSDWPAVGSRVHHSIGPWPMSINDSTSVSAMVPDSRLELDAHLWLIGAALVRIELMPTSDGGTRVIMAEKLVEGPGRLAPEALQGMFLRPRNRESLRRLQDMAVGRAGS